MYIICMYAYIYIYIYIERERYTHTHIHIYSVCNITCRTLPRLRADRRRPCKLRKRGSVASENVMPM